LCLLPQGFDPTPSLTAGYPAALDGVFVRDQLGAAARGSQLLVAAVVGMAAPGSTRAAVRAGWGWYRSGERLVVRSPPETRLASVPVLGATVVQRPCSPRHRPCCGGEGGGLSGIFSTAL